MIEWHKRLLKQMMEQFNLDSYQSCLDFIFIWGWFLLLFLRLCFKDNMVKKNQLILLFLCLNINPMLMPKKSILLISIQSDIKVFVVEYETQADLKVF